MFLLINFFEGYGSCLLFELYIITCSINMPYNYSLLFATNRCGYGAAIICCISTITQVEENFARSMLADQ